MWMVGRIGRVLLVGLVAIAILLVPNTPVVGLSGQQSVPPPSNMVSWWPGDGNANDIVGGNNGTLVGGVTFATGEVGQAFLLDGIDDYVDAGNASNLAVSSGDFTVDAWVKFNGITNDMSIVDKSTSFPNLDGWRLIKQADNRFWFCFGGGYTNRCYDPAYTLFSTTYATTDVWYHVAVVKTSSNFSLYVNGVLEDSRSPLPSFLDTNTADLLLGATSQAYNWGTLHAYLNGLIDEIELFNRALSPSEIFAIFNAGHAGKCKVVCFSAFSAKVEITLASSAFDVNSTFTLSRGIINPLAQDVTFQLGSSSIVIPAGSFRQGPHGKFLFEGTINGVALSANLTPLGGNRYAFRIEGAGASNLPTGNPVTVSLIIGVNDTGIATVTAEIQ